MLIIKLMTANVVINNTVLNVTVTKQLRDARYIEFFTFCELSV